jgi:hypothetical protein
MRVEEREGGGPVGRGEPKGDDGEEARQGWRMGVRERVPGGE